MKWLIFQDMIFLRYYLHKSNQLVFRFKQNDADVYIFKNK